MYMQKTDWWTNRVCLSLFYVHQITSSWWRQQLFVLETNKDKEKGEEEKEKFMRQLCTHITYLNPFTMPRFSEPTGTGWHLSRFIQMIWQIQVKSQIFLICLLFLLLLCCCLWRSIIWFAPKHWPCSVQSNQFIVVVQLTITLFKCISYIIGKVHSNISSIPKCTYSDVVMYASEYITYKVVYK